MMLMIRGRKSCDSEYHKKEGKIMKQVLLFFSVFICFPCLSSAGNHPYAYGGIPSNSAYIERNAYIIQLDPVRKTPRWQ
jgi:hypothetical protein